MSVTLYSGALTTRETALASLGRGKLRAEGDDELIMSAVNYATAEMERVTNRRLAVRTYAKVGAVDTRLRLDGEGDNYLQVSEYPLNTLTSVALLDDSGNETAFSLTGARISAFTGRVWLPINVPPGDGNLLVTCNAGYIRPTDTVTGHPAWYDLERLCLRLTTIIYQDLAKQVGRITDASLLSVSSRIPGFELPADLKAGLLMYRRLW